jgi:hypothetical protein
MFAPNRRILECLAAVELVQQLDAGATGRIRELVLDWANGPKS